MPLPSLPNLPKLDPQLLKKNLPLVIAGVSALAAVFLINVYIKQQAEKEKQKAVQEVQSQVTVVVAAKDIPKGAMISEDMLVEKKAPKEKVPDGIANSLARVVEKFAVKPIPKGQAVYLKDLAAPQRSGAGGPGGASREGLPPLAARIPPGKRAVTINVDNLSSLAGLLRPGDYVDLVGLVSIPASASAQAPGLGRMTTLPLFQNILVLAAGSSGAGSPGTTGSVGTATLALSPQETNIVTFIQEQGKVRLVLRSPQDKQAQHSIPADWDTVLKMLLPQEPSSTTGKVEFKPKRTVEIYHGARKEIRPLE